MVRKSVILLINLLNVYTYALTHHLRTLLIRTNNVAGPSAREVISLLKADSLLV